MSIRDKLYGARLVGPARVRVSAMEGPGPEGPRYLPRDCDVKCSEALLRLVHVRLAQDTSSEGLGLRPDDLRTRVKALLDSMGSDSEFRALPGFEADLASLVPMADRFAEFVVEDLFGLGPLAALLDDPQVGEIMVNGYQSIFYVSDGLKLHARRFLDERHLRAVLGRLLSLRPGTGLGSLLVPQGAEVEDLQAISETRLADGSQLFVVLPPVSQEGISLTIRKVAEVPFMLSDLVERAMLNQKMAVFLEAAVRAKLNIIISGGASTGKTSLMNALMYLIPSAERIIVIEESPQLRVAAKNRVMLQTHVALAREGGVTVKDLVQTALRMRPDRVILGECRGPETLFVILAMNAGLSGCMTTAHASSPRNLMNRLVSLGQTAGLNLSDVALERQAGHAFHLVIHTDRAADGTVRIVNLCGIAPQLDGTIQFTDVFVYEPGEDETTPGSFKATGLVPPFQDRLERSGIKLPANIYSAE